MTDTRVVSGTEMRRVLQRRSSKDYEDPRWVSVLAFIWLTGARVSEALAVTPRDIDYVVYRKHRFARVSLLTLKQRGRYKLRRRVSLVDLERDGDLWQYIEKRVEPMVREDAKIWYCNRKSVWRKCKEYFDVRTHALRHSRVMEMDKLGVSPLRIKELMGWRSMSMLEVYYHDLGWKQVAKELIDSS